MFDEEREHGANHEQDACRVCPFADVPALMALPSSLRGGRGADAAQGAAALVPPPKPATPESAEVHRPVSESSSGS